MTKKAKRELTLTRKEIQDHAYRIAAEYGGNLTVRQLYYQFVARGLLPSGQKVYKRVVNAVAKARLEGRFPFNWIQDRTRDAKASSQFENKDSVASAIDECEEMISNLPYYTLGRDRWFGQPKYVTVGVEKEALAGVFEEPCTRLGVGLFVFRGYSSLSSLYQLVKNLEQAQHAGADEAVMLYFGDFDPDGWEIPRSAAKSVNEISWVTGKPIPHVTWKRPALNMDQIERYDPPAFEAKVTSSRYQGYIDEHGTDDAWELDALPPNVLVDLIRESVNAEFDQSIWQQNQTLIDARRAELRRRICDIDWLSGVLEGV